MNSRTNSYEPNKNGAASQRIRNNANKLKFTNRKSMDFERIHELEYIDNKYLKY